MKFQKCILINFEQTHGRTHGQAESNMPLQLFQSWGHNNICPFNFSKVGGITIYAPSTFPKLVA